jgi:hypothetical protein
MKKIKKIEYNISNLILYLLLFALICLIAIRNNVTIGDVDPLAFIGAIIGGIITLAGVHYTIKSSNDALILTLQIQDDAKFIESMGIKLQQLNKVKGIIYRADRLLSNRKFGWNEIYEKDDIKKIDSNFYTFFFPNLDALLEISASVDWKFYNDIKTFVDETRKYIFDMNEESIKKLYDPIEQLIEKIHKHEDRLSTRYNEISNMDNDKEHP